MSSNSRRFRTALLGASALVSAAALMAGPAAAQEARAFDFDMPAQPLTVALKTFGATADQQLIFSEGLVKGRTAPPLKGAYTPEQALAMLLAGSGLIAERTPSGVVTIQSAADPQGSSAADGAEGTVDTLIVTAQKREEDIQDVPIAISAFSQEDLETRQVAGGPDLITQIPNFSFTKTNFTSYSIQIRGIGTQAISATTDPAVAVAFNNTPFIRNRFFEQEFFDLERLEVLRGPQGTLYGRNATAGVVNLISAKPKFAYEAKASVDLGNYSSTRIEGMINFPLVEDVVALRVAGAMTKRDGYALNQMTGEQIDGRELWSTRVSLRFEPTDWLRANFIYEHFQEDDDRLRSGKQLCKKHVVDHIGTLPITTTQGGAFGINTYVSQGCAPGVSLYSAEAFQTPNGYALPFYGPTANLGNPVFQGRDPYLSATQSRDLRVIESSVKPDYRAKTDIAELQVALDIGESLTLNSETSYSTDELFSLQDYNRFTTATDAFSQDGQAGAVDSNGAFCDPQLGCSDRLLLVDLSTSESSQFSQEFRLGSDFDGPINFSLGANYLRHDAEDKYYVFINSLSLFVGNSGWGPARPYIPGVSTNAHCQNGPGGPGPVGDIAPYSDPSRTYVVGGCSYIDPNPIGSLNDQGRNYFLSKNPYKLISYAAFGELYYQVTPALKITGGLRFTVDRKQAPQIPSWLLASRTSGPYPVALTVDQEWKEPTGRLAVDWKPVLGFTDETLVYASYAHGYKAGGANPPPPVLVQYGPSYQEFIPNTFGPEFVDAFEVGTKNTLLGGALTLNLTGFYYDYKGYQTSEIRNRSAVNSNYDAEVWGAELEADWRVTEALRLGVKGGYNMTRIGDGQEAIDLMDRPAGDTDWMVVRPFPTIPSNCVIPIYVLTAGNQLNVGGDTCYDAYYLGLDPVTLLPYVPNPTVRRNTNPFNPNVPLGPAYVGYEGFNPLAPEINGGRGFTKDLGGNELPNAPNYTATVTVDYTMPLRSDWMVTFHGDYHYQGESWARVFNSDPYDRIEAFSTVNASAIFVNEAAGWKVMTYVKNVFDETAITGSFLNSDDTGLTTNVFLTEPRLYGVRVTKDFTGGGWLGDFGQRHEGPYALTVELGGGTGWFSNAGEDYAPDWLALYGPGFPTRPSIQDQDLDWGDTRSVEITYAPSKEWRVSGAYRFGRTNSGVARGSAYEAVAGGYANASCPFGPSYCPSPVIRAYGTSQDNHWRGAASGSEEYEIVDLVVGREVGFGAWGDGGWSMVGLGVRSAELTSTSRVEMTGIPARVSPPEYTYADPFFALPGFPIRQHETYTTSLESRRGFEGVGPSAVWEASVPLFGDEERGHVDVDWSVTGGVLFGKQTSDSNEDLVARRDLGSYNANSPANLLPILLYDTSVPRSRSDDVTVPNLSLTLGLSYTIDRVKVSTGYSYDRFFDAVDGGYKDAQSHDRTIQGPYLRLAVGFGG